MGKFQELHVWQSAKDMAVGIYEITKNSELSRDFGLSSQLQRASVSIASNIAEGDESGTNRNSVRYFYNAKGSAAEVQTQINIAHEIGYINTEIKDHFINECDKISIMLKKLIKSRSENL